MNIQPDVVITSALPVAAVDSHADSDFSFARPALCREGALGAGSRGQGIGRFRKHGKESVTVGADFDAGVLADRPAQDGSMTLEQLRVLVSQALEEPR